MSATVGSRIAVAGTAIAFAVVLLLVSTPVAIVVSLAEKIALFLPGLLIVRAAAGPAAGWLPVVAFGPFIGFALSSLSLLGLWLLGARGLWTLAAAPVIVLALVPFASRARHRWPFPVTAGGDRAALALLLLLVPVIVGAPFAHVGEPLPEGKAYRAYFTADYVWRRAVVAELAKGDVLPANPFFRDDELHYYWLPHLTSAVAYRSGQADLDELLLMHSVVMDAAFASFLFGLARWFVPVSWAAALGAATTLVATSYEGLWALWDFWRKDVPLTLVRYLNIDAVTRWTFHAMPIDGLQRVLFYQPHHALGYGLGFMGLLAVCTRVRRFDPMAMAVGGVLLGLSTLVSSFAGLMLTCAAALWEAGSVLRWREWWRATVHVAAASLPLVLAAALVTALRYVDVGGSIVRFGPNLLAFADFWRATALSFGPITLISAIAAGVMLGRGDTRGWLFVALWVTCAAFYFYVDVRDHQDVYVGWRAGHLWFIASAPLAAMAFTWLSGLAPRRRFGMITLVAVAVLAAIPTTGIDIYNTQDIYNWAQGPGFSWTLLISSAEQEAFAWIRANTAPGAVFQLDAWERGADGWATMAAFAERRLAVGLPISMVPLQKYEEGSRRAAWIFDHEDVDAVHALAARNGVEYLFVGGPERRRHPGVQERFDAASGYFQPVFRNDEVTIYRVR